MPLERGVKMSLQKSGLQQTRENSYHARLLESPSLAGLIEENYRGFFENFHGEKIRIDTTNSRGIGELTEILKKK